MSRLWVIILPVALLTLALVASAVYAQLGDTQTATGVINAAPGAITVAIDIKPRGDPNSINPNSGGKIPVAILSAADFDAPSQIDKASLTFGPTGDEESLVSCSSKSKDFNRDRLLDLICHFDADQAGFECGDTDGILRGNTVGGLPIEGSDSVRIAPCP